MWVLHKYNVHIDTTLYGIVFNMHKDQPMLDHIVLEAKCYIYKCFLSKIKPSLAVFVNRINEVKSLEEVIARDKNKLELHYAKWFR